MNDEGDIPEPPPYRLPQERPSREAHGHEELPRRRRHRRSHADDLRPGEMHYNVEDVPPWYICLLLAFQHYLVMFGTTVTNPLVLFKYMCLKDTPQDQVVKAHIIGTIFVTSGISTLLQSTIGVRLPVVQGGCFAYLIPTVALMSLPEWECPPDTVATTTVSPDVTPWPITSATYSVNATSETEHPWMERMREIQGAIMVASLFEVFIGASGVLCFLLKYIGPLAIAPTIALVGLSLFETVASFASKQWWIALVTVMLIAAFSQYTKNVNVPCFHFNRQEGCSRTDMPIFRLFPVILAVGITWLICAILTVTKVFPENPDQWGHAAQTDLRIDVMHSAPWFRLPYPGQWGWPTLSVAGVFGMLAGVLASIIESLGDYYACARLAGAPPTPMHAVNRGIGIEGISSLISGAFGHGTGTTTYSENIGAIGITKVASRRVIQLAAIIMIVFGVFDKFGAIFVTIPDPVVGGVFIVMLGMVVAVGMSNLQFVDLNSSRNLFIIGFSFFFGLTLPQYLKSQPKAISTGNREVDQIITVLLSTSMFVGGLAGFVLDNTIPGTEAERGILTWKQHIVSKNDTTNAVQREAELQTLTDATYRIPGITQWLKSKSWAKYIPFLPTFDEKLFGLRCGSCCKKKQECRNNHNERTVSPV